MVLERLSAWLPYLAGFLLLTLGLVTACHAILYKRDPRASVSWSGVILLVPLVGPILYLLFGINRIQRKAVSLRRRRKRVEGLTAGGICTQEDLFRGLSPEFVHLAPVARVAESITGRPLLLGNRVTALYNGEEAYPEMLAAIGKASRSVSLLAYIFELDVVGQKFVDAIVEARKRGAEVRILIDDVGSDDAVEDALAAGGVTVSRFHPVRRPWRSRYMNLRDHRKILVVDGEIGFTGGMNIRRSHLVATKQPHHEQDVQFKLEGPVVSHLQEAFVEDWAFATGEMLKSAAWFPDIKVAGDAMARGIAADPGESQDVLRWVIIAAIGCAKSRVRIVTPYFLPDPALVAALNVAALRGIQVDILLPEENDSRVVKWASTAMLWQVLTGGCRVWITPPPFDHTKILIVDGAWTFFGSANLDPRSLRLNFEFNVECYDRALATALEKRIEEKIGRSSPISLKSVDGRRFGIRMRDALARLFMPYL